MLMWLAIAVVFLLACVALSLVYKTRKHLHAAQQKFEEQLSALRRELSAVNNAAVGVGRHLMTTEKKLAKSIEVQQQLEASSTDYLPYRQAADMVEKGASASELIDHCGLPTAEANLMTLMQKSANK
jgi:hypothetical protein